MLAAFSCSAKIPDNQAVKAIVGEASGEPYATQVAIGAVIRNRGSLQGVYGPNAPHVAHESQAVFNKAAKAWAESAKHDPTHGCRYWGGPMDVGYFNGLGKKPAMKIGHTNFYR